MHVGDVAHLKVGDSIDIKQLKNQKYRRATLNGEAYRALQSWLDAHPDPRSDVPLFRSQKGEALSVSAVNQLVKKWCRTIELQGNYGSHSMRKSWGYHQRMQLDTPVALLMRAYGHATEMQTLEYLCIQPEELKSLYLKMEL
ncbi:tyrosine-type recombinase/integrase [Aurantivibrio plasticivorans]